MTDQEIIEGLTQALLPSLSSAWVMIAAAGLLVLLGASPAGQVLTRNLPLNY